MKQTIKYLVAYIEYSDKNSKVDIFDTREEALNKIRHVITGNDVEWLEIVRLENGDCVYRNPREGWVAALAQADILSRFGESYD